MLPPISDRDPGDESGVEEEPLPWDHREYHGFELRPSEHRHTYGIDADGNPYCVYCGERMEL